MQLMDKLARSRSALYAILFLLIAMDAAVSLWRRTFPFSSSSSSSSSNSGGGGTLTSACKISSLRLCSLILCAAALTHALCCCKDALDRVQDALRSSSAYQASHSTIAIAIVQPLLLLVPFELASIFDMRSGIFVATPLLVRSSVALLCLISLRQCIDDENMKELEDPTSAGALFVSRALLNFVCIAFSLLIWSEWSWRFPILLFATIVHTLALIFAEELSENRFETVTLILLASLDITVQHAFVVEPLRLS